MTPLARAIDERLIGEFSVAPAEANDAQWLSAVARLLREDLAARAQGFPSAQDYWAALADYVIHKRIG